MRVRLREKPPKYEGTRDNFASSDHAMRTLVTGSMISTVAPKFVCDPACGDGSVLEAAFRHRPFDFAILGDISQAQVDVLRPAFPHSIECGDIATILGESERVDMVVLTEILEHLEDPEFILRLARSHSTFLIASSPIGDPEDGRNHEHLWAWDEADYGAMLEEQGWTPMAKAILTYPGSPWNSQIWMAK